jgi:ankyrin repeat protein
MTKPPRYFDDTDAIVTAAYHGEYDNVIVLINRGADVNAKDEYGNTGIICASEQGYDAIVELLINAGGDLNATNNDGDSALDLARHAKHTSTTSLLLNHGATGRDGPSAKERMEDAYYDACQIANNIKSGMFSDKS